MVEKTLTQRQYLAKLRQLLASSWSPTHLAADFRGRRIDPNSVLAKTWSITGAMFKLRYTRKEECEEENRRSCTCLYLSAITLTLWGQSFSRWELEAGRTREDILFLLDLLDELYRQPGYTQVCNYVLFRGSNQPRALAFLECYRPLQRLAA